MNPSASTGVVCQKGRSTESDVAVGTSVEVTVSLHITFDNLATSVEDSGGWDNNNEPKWK